MLTLRTRRESLGLTQADLAQKVETTPNYISMIESGKVKLPNAELRRAIGARLDVLARKLAVFGAAPARAEYIERESALKLAAIALTVDPNQARTVMLRLGVRARLRSTHLVRLVWPAEVAPFFASAGEG